MAHDDTLPLNLLDLARQAMDEVGFETTWPPAVQAEIGALDSLPPAAAPLRDLRTLLWSSIDNVESQDLDQVEWASQEADGAIRLLIGIADVDALVPQDSAIDARAAVNTTSVYTGVATFPMLPEALSNQRTSLLADADRLAMITEMTVGADGAITPGGVYQALVRNYAKLDYDSVGAWLEGRAAPPALIDAIPGLEEQVRLQELATRRLKASRDSNGALEFETVEATPVAVAGQIVDLKVKRKNRARYLIEDCMIAANGVMAETLAAHGFPLIQRIVRTPERWDRIMAIAAAEGEQLPAAPDSRALAQFLERRRAADPEGFPDLSLAVVKLLGAGEYTVVQPGVAHEGHFGLAVQNYTHSTAPNRRYVDLIVQRLVKAANSGQPAPYSIAQLDALASHCMEREKAARSVERRMRKVVAAGLLRQREGEIFEAIVTGASAKGVFVRLTAPPVEGRVTAGEAGLDVGDRVQVRLLSTDPARGFVDFEHISATAPPSQRPGLPIR